MTADWIMDGQVVEIAWIVIVFIIGRVKVANIQIASKARIARGVCRKRDLMRFKARNRCQQSFCSAPRYSSSKGEKSCI